MALLSTLVEGAVRSGRSVLMLILLPLVLYCMYSLFFHPLRRYPGPTLAKLSPLWMWYHTYYGTEAHTIHSLHVKYQSDIVRISPNALSLSSSEAISPIYVSKGGLKKPPFYRNFHIDGHDTIFATQDSVYRAQRAKAVVSLFAANKVRDSFESERGACRPVLEAWLQRLRRKRARAASAGHRVRLNLNDECRRLAIDVLTTYLFDKSYGALQEDSSQDGDGANDAQPASHSAMSATGFVDEFVAVGRFFRLPPSLLSWLLAIVERCYPSQEVARSMDCVHTFAETLTRSAEPSDDTYQSRLLFQAEISASETTAQLKDLMFAGTDSTATALATIWFHLLQQPSLLARLKAELAAGKNSELLDAVVKEGLRVSMPNPARLPRLVPTGSELQVLGETIPGGVEVGCSSWCLHHDSAVFRDAQSFLPDRWMHKGSSAGKDEEMSRMNANMFPFSAGPRQCIARNLAQEELIAATRALALSGCLDGCKTVHDKISLMEWFNSRLEDGCVDVWWPTS